VVAELLHGSSPPDPWPQLPEPAPSLGLRHGLGPKFTFETDRTLVIILFRLSEPEGFFEVVRPRRLGPEHGQHA